MDGGPDPDEIRARKFELVRRGYDRAAVDRFKDEVAVALAAVQSELEELRARFAESGMAEVADLKAELDAVGEDIAEILGSAREAAEGMRSRASEDAARWRAEADQEVRELRSAARKDAEEARGSAWEAGTKALAQADEEAQGVLEQARQDALFIRAEAEREALRLSGDARRDGEEVVRAARSQGERLLMEARSEADDILAAARQSAQNAQERARALEQRRSELMQELEAARLSIGQLEQEIDSRREALQAAADAPDSGVRVLKQGVDPPVAWFDEDATVRIVSASNVPIEEPVDPDEFIADVEQLKSEPPPPPEPVPAADAGEEAEEPEAAVEPEAVEEEETEPADLEPEEQQDEPDEPEPAEPAAEAVAPQDPAPEPVVSAAEPAAPEPDGLSDLFAELRTASVPEPEPPPSPVVLEPEPEEVVAAAPVAVLTEEESPVDGEAADLSADPFDLRDRVLLPIQNRTLRAVKRQIVDLQNRVLEELRVEDGEWAPESSMFMAALADDISRLNAESFVAGHAAAAELLGEKATAPPSRPADQDAVGEFVAGLTDSVATAVQQTRASGGASRQITAAVGRVFRAWRTDEAERRLRHSAFGAFNAGLSGAYPGLGVERVMALAPGTPCGDCPAGTGKTWAPGGAAPAGTSMPPASPGCRAVVVPAR